MKSQPLHSLNAPALPTPPLSRPLTIPLKGQAILPAKEANLSEQKLFTSLPKALVDKLSQISTQ